MATYSSTNPVRKILATTFSATSGGSLYAYESTATSTEITATSFFAGAAFGSASSACVGMVVGDILMAVNLASNAITWHRVTAITSSTGWHSSCHATVGAGSS